MGHQEPGSYCRSAFDLLFIWIQWLLSIWKYQQFPLLINILQCYRIVFCIINCGMIVEKVTAQKGKLGVIAEQNSHVNRFNSDIKHGRGVSPTTDHFCQWRVLCIFVSQLILFFICHRSLHQPLRRGDYKWASAGWQLTCNTHTVGQGSQGIGRRWINSSVFWSVGVIVVGNSLEMCPLWLYRRIFGWHHRGGNVAGTVWDWLALCISGGTDTIWGIVAGIV